MIRAARESDAAEIARIINLAFEVERGFRRGERTSESEVRELMGNEAFFVAEVDGRLVGAIEARVDGAAGYFGMLAVDPSARRGGVGAALVRTAEGHCRGLGCTRMTLSTGEERAELIPWYEKMGYRLTDVRVSSNPAFKRPIRVVTLERPLAGP